MDEQVVWEDPAGFEPSLRLESRLVRARTLPKQPAGGAAPKNRKKPYASIRCPMDMISLPSVTSHGRKVTQVSRFRASTEENEDLMKALIASNKKNVRMAEWLGEPKKHGTRTYYPAAKVKNSFTVRAGDTVLLTPPSAARSGWEAALPWVALVRDLFEDGHRNMMFTCVWFYR
jgi:hypothetical protein